MIIYDIYVNIIGKPNNNATKIITSYYTSRNALTLSTIEGDWLQYGFPYQLQLITYIIQFASSVINTVTIESNPKTWYILGSNDNSIWYLLNNVDNYATTTIYTSSNLTTDNTAYLYFRLVITNSKTALQTTGLSLTGIYSVTLKEYQQFHPIMIQQ